MRALATLLVLVAVGAIAPAAATAAPARETGRVGTLEQELFSQLNALRTNQGLLPLRQSDALSRAAMAHSSEMAALGYFSHLSANGARFDRRIERFYPSKGRKYWSVGENLLWWSPDVDAAGVVAMWLASPLHRLTLLTPRWRDIGVAAVHVDLGPGMYGGDPVTVVTADFGVRR
jgi:uncharacterized protein YkwD